MHLFLKTARVRLPLVILGCVAGIYAISAHSQTIDANAYYRLTTQWQGEGKSLDVVNDGRNNKLQLADTGNYFGQFWKLTKVSSAQPAAKKRAVEAGPIWIQADAEEKCPRVVSQNNGTWTREWWTTIQGKMSVSEIR